MFLGCDLPKIAAAKIASYEASMTIDWITEWKIEWKIISSCNYEYVTFYA